MDLIIDRVVEKGKTFQKNFKSGDEISIGDRLHGYIAKYMLSHTNFFLVRVSHNTFVRVMIKNLDDYFVPAKIVRERVKAGKFVTLRVTGIEYVCK
jgi:phosphotransferase system IIA component